MALRATPFPTQTSSFSLPQMASLRSPKFVMASTLRSGAKSVIPFSDPFSIHRAFHFILNFLFFFYYVHVLVDYSLFNFSYV